jgi:hypothetical protein
MEHSERRQDRKIVVGARVWVVVACLVLALPVCAPLASEAAVLATYRFNDTLAADQPGAPALVAVNPRAANVFQTADVFGQSRRVYRFDGLAVPDSQQAGLVLATTGLTSPARYSVEVVFAFDAAAGYRRLLDVEDRKSDNGVYVNPGNQLELFANDETLAFGETFTNAFHHVALVVDAGTVTAYVDGAVQFTFATGAMSLDNPNNPNRLINFFLDNVSGGAGGEYSSGRVALIRLHDGALTGGEVVQLSQELHGLPSLTVVLNDTALVPGDALTLTATLVPGTTPGLVDAYILILLPGGGTVLSVVPTGVALGLVPLVSNVTPVAISAPVFGYTFTGLEPPGTYIVFVALTQAGTLNVLGAVQQAPFSFTP